MLDVPRANVKIDVSSRISDDEQHEITTYRVRNPLANRYWNQILMDIRGHLEKEIDAWRDAWMKKLIPEKFYKDAHSGTKERAKKCFDYMERERIELVHPDGHSLERQIWNKGKMVARFVIELINE